MPQNDLAKSISYKQKELLQRLVENANRSMRSGLETSRLIPTTSLNFPERKRLNTSRR